MPINNIGKSKVEDCAVIIIDMQNDFVREGAPIQCPGAEEIIPNILALKGWAARNGVPVFYTQEVHRRQKVDYGMETERSEPEHCLEGTTGVEIIAELPPGADDYVIVKRRYSSFYLTDLDILMRGLGRSTLIITGVATNVCVYATALDAHQRDMRSIVLSDCVAGTKPELHEAFLRNIDYVLGDVVTSGEMMGYFAAGNA